MGVLQFHRQRWESVSASQALPKGGVLELPQSACRSRQRVRAILSGTPRGTTQALISLSEFDYDLPKELIAQRPLERREDSRMLVIYRQEQRCEDRRFVEFPSFLRPGDCVVLNNSRVIPSRLFGHREGTRS